MPIYVFFCANCQKEHEIFYQITDESRANTKCPECGEKMSQKITGGRGFVDKTAKTLGSFWDKQFHRDIAESTPEKIGMDKKDMDKLRRETHDNKDKYKKQMSAAKRKKK